MASCFALKKKKKEKSVEYSNFTTKKKTSIIFIIHPHYYSHINGMELSAIA